jgi:hypothetical protein
VFTRGSNVLPPCAATVIMTAVLAVCVIPVAEGFGLVQVDDADYSCGFANASSHAVTANVVVFGPRRITLRPGCVIHGRLVLRDSRGLASSVATNASSVLPVASFELIAQRAVIQGGISVEMAVSGGLVSLLETVVGALPVEALPTPAATAAPVTVLPPSNGTPAPPAAGNNATNNKTNTTAAPPPLNTVPPNTTVAPTATSVPTASAAPTGVPLLASQAPFSGRSASGTPRNAWPAVLRCGRSADAPPTANTIGIEFTKTARYVTLRIMRSAICAFASPPPSMTSITAAVIFHSDVGHGLIHIEDSVLNASTVVTGSIAAVSASTVRFVGSFTNSSRLHVVQASLLAACDSPLVTSMSGSCAGVEFAGKMTSQATLDVADGVIIAVMAASPAAAAIIVTQATDSALFVSPRSLEWDVSDGLATARVPIGGPFGPDGSSDVLDELLVDSVAPQAAWTKLFKLAPSNAISFTVRGANTGQQVRAAIWLQALRNVTALIGGLAIDVKADGRAYGVLVSNANSESSISFAAVNITATTYRTAGTFAIGVQFTLLQGVSVLTAATSVAVNAGNYLTAYGIYMGPTLETTTVLMVNSFVDGVSYLQIGIVVDQCRACSLSLLRTTVDVWGDASTCIQLKDLKDSTVFAISSSFIGFASTGVWTLYTSINASTANLKLVFGGTTLESAAVTSTALAWRGTTAGGWSRCSTARVNDGAIQQWGTVCTPQTPAAAACGTCVAAIDCAGGVIDIRSIGSTLSEIAATIPPPAATSTSATASANTTTPPASTLAGNATTKAPVSTPAAGNATTKAPPTTAAATSPPTAPPVTADPTNGLCRCYQCDRLATLPGVRSAALATRNASFFCFPRSFSAVESTMVSTALAVDAFKIGYAGGIRAGRYRRTASVSTSLAQSATESRELTVSDDVTITRSPVRTRSRTPTRTQVATYSEELTITDELVPTETVSTTMGAAFSPYRTVLARAMNAAGLSDANANRVAIASSVVFALLSFATPLVANKGINLDMITSAVECHFDPFDETLTIPPYRQVMYPYPVGSGPLAYARGAVCTAVAMIAVPQCITACILRFLKFHYKLRVVCGLIAVTTCAYFAGTAAYYGSLMVAVGSSMGERLVGGGALVMVLAVIGFPGYAVTSMPSLYLAYRMFDRGARCYDVLSVRLYLLVDVFVSCLFGAIDAIRFPLTKEQRDERTDWRGYGKSAMSGVHPANPMACVSVCGVMCLVAAGYVGYIVAYRPVADQWQLLFLLLLSLVQVAVAAASATAVYVPGALEVLGLLAILQLCLLGCMVVAVLLAKAVTQSTVSRQAAVEVADAEKAAAAPDFALPSRLPDSDDEAEQPTHSVPPEDATPAELANARRALGYAGLSLFEEELQVNRLHFGLSPAEERAKAARLEAAGDDGMSAAERRRLHLERLKARDEAEAKLLDAEMSPSELRRLKVEEKAVRNLARYNTYGYGRSVREVDGELLARWLRDEGLSPVQLAALSGFHDPAVVANARSDSSSDGAQEDDVGRELDSVPRARLPTNAGAGLEQSLVGASVRLLESELTERRQVSRHARAALVFTARQRVEGSAISTLEVPARAAGLPLPPPPPGPTASSDASAYNEDGMPNPVARHDRGHINPLGGMFQNPAASVARTREEARRASRYRPASSDDGGSDDEAGAQQFSPNARRVLSPSDRKTIARANARAYAAELVAGNANDDDCRYL